MDKAEEITEYVVKAATARDLVLQRIAAYITDGWPACEATPQPDKPYHQAQGELAIVNVLVTIGNRIVIHEAMQQEVLRKIHEGPQGKFKCCQ